MKKLIFTISLLVFGTLAGQVNASATPTPKSDSTVSKKLDSQINQLKEKIASRVSELNLVEKRGMIGIVTDIKGNQITITDAEGNLRYVDVDEITKYSSTGQTKFGLTDLKKDTKISVLGIYNKQSKRMLARFVKTYAPQTILSGGINAIDAKNFQLTIVTPDQKERKVDIATTTKLFSYSPDGDLVKYGFSKLAIGDRIQVAGSADREDATLFEATRLIDYLGVPKDPNVVITAPTTAAPTSATTKQATPTPTTAAKKSLSPIR